MPFAANNFQQHFSFSHWAFEMKIKKRRTKKNNKMKKLKKKKKTCCVSTRSLKNFELYFDFTFCTLSFFSLLLLFLGDVLFVLCFFLAFRSTQFVVMVKLFYLFYCIICCCCCCLLERVWVDRSFCSIH